jgi:hypothetical protein
MTIKEVVLVNQTVKVGDIFVSQWGYDANLVDFYKVIKKTETTVTVVEIQSLSLNTGNRYEGGNHVTCGTEPVMEREFGDYNPETQTRPVISETPKTLRRKLKTRYSGEPSFDVNEYAIARLWDGQPVLEYNNH